jgi:probable phosphoglycerate mutase
MRLLLVRHGATAETGKRLSGRLPGVGLSESGRATVERLAGRLADLTLDAVYTSPVERCAETAEIIARPHHVRPREIEDLTEADYGRWTGRTLTSLYRLKAWPRLMAGASRFRFPDGETLREVQARAVGTIEHLATRHGGGALAAVSHADVIRVILAHYL